MHVLLCDDKYTLSQPGHLSEVSFNVCNRHIIERRMKEQRTLILVPSFPHLNVMISFEREMLGLTWVKPSYICQCENGIIDRFTKY